MKVPDDLKNRVNEQLQQNPSWRWDAAVAEIAAAAEDRLLTPEGGAA